MVEHMAAGVIVEDDALSGRSGEEGLLEFLGHEKGAGEVDGFVFLAGAGVHQQGWWRGIEPFGEGGGIDHHGAVVGIGLAEVAEHFPGVVSARACGEAGEGFVIGETAALAAAEVVAGEERAPGPGVGGEDEGHGGIDARLAHVRGG